MRDPWLPFGVPRRDASVRLFAFPYAGGGASGLRELRACLPAHVDACPVQLPGREGRYGEPPVTEMTALADQLFHALRPHLDAPYAVLGYSMGAAVACEFVDRVRQAGLAQPVHFLACARGGPNTRPGWADQGSGDAALMQRLKDMGGTADEVMQNPELMELVLPVLRADFTLNASFQWSGQRLDCPLTAIGGTDDPFVTPQQLHDWAQVTRGPVQEKWIAGGHFFMRQRPDEFAGAVARALALVGRDCATAAH